MTRISTFARNAFQIFATCFVLVNLTGCLDIDGDGQNDVNLGLGGEICLGSGNFHFCTEFGWGNYGKEFAYCDSSDDMALDFGQDWCPGLTPASISAMNLIINTDIETWDLITIDLSYDKNGEWVTGDQVIMENSYVQYDSRTFLSTPSPPIQGRAEISGFITYTLNSGEGQSEELFCNRRGTETLTILQNGESLRFNRQESMNGCFVAFNFGQSGEGEEPTI